MAGGKLVTTKEQGFQMMADYINREAGCNWTRVQCEGKYRCVSFLQLLLGVRVLNLDQELGEEFQGCEGLLFVVWYRYRGS